MTRFSEDYVVLTKYTRKEWVQSNSWYLLQAGGAHSGSKNISYRHVGAFPLISPCLGHLRKQHWPAQSWPSAFASPTIFMTLSDNTTEFKTELPNFVFFVLL